MGIPHVDPNYIKSTVLPLPPKCEQRTIAAFLDRKTEAIDGLIEKKEQLIERLKEKRQALITKAVTKALDDNAPMKNLGVEWLGEIPKDWEVTLFKRGFHVQLGKMLQNNKKSQNESQEYYLRAANIQWNDVNTGYLKKMWFNTEEKRKYNLKEGDLLVSEGGDVGRASIWHNEIEECYFQNAINRVRAKNLNRNKFAYYWIFFLKHAGYIDMICSKATISHLTAEKLENLPLLLPPVKEQISIIEELDHNLNKMRNIKSAIAEQIKKLKEYRQSLISAAVTGKIDVRDEMEVESKKMMI
jgi:type I restriction enzyme S subunit